VGINPVDIDAVFLTHFHGDHTLGLPTFVLHRIFVDEPRTLTLVGPPGLQARLGALFEASWGPDWKAVMLPRFKARYVVARPRGQAAGFPYQSVKLDHGSMGCTGYRIRVGDRILAYSGDTEPTAPLEKLVKGADVAIVEATGPGDVFSHMSWEEAAALKRRHPKTRFVFNHVYSGTFDGAARDFQVVEI
jgi:ribonuclease BN (tRNA processing enzyme)